LPDTSKNESNDSIFLQINKQVTYADFNSEKREEEKLYNDAYDLLHF